MLAGSPLQEAGLEQGRLQDLIARLSAAHRRSATPAELHDVIVDAVDFARAHALDEEAVMAASSYPELNRHRSAHEQIIRRLSALAGRSDDAQAGAAEEAEAVLRGWLERHFEEHDRRFHEYLVAYLLRRLYLPGAGEADDAGGAEARDERFRAIVEAAPNAILVVDQRGLICVVNSQVERLFGFSRSELIGQPVEMLVPPRFREEHARQRAAFAASPQVRAMGEVRDLYGLRKDGNEVPIEIGLSPMHTVEGRFLLASVVDITRRKEADLVMRSAEANALRESILRSLPASVLATDPEGIIVAANPAAERLLGYSRDELVGRPAIEIHDQDEIRNRSIELSKYLGIEVAPGFQVLVASGSRDTADERDWAYCRKDGTRLPVHIAITTLRDASGKVIGFLMVASDISARKRAEASIRYMADHDALTGLPNRNLLADRLAMAVRSARRSKLQLAVLLLDLDQFKQVNDSLGHQIGDELLLAVAKRLESCVREVDTVARLGGDEFVIVVTDVRNPDDLEPLIGQIASAVSRPLRVDRHELHVTPSIGGCLFPRDGQDVATLLKKADSAMYQAKASGRGTFKWFTEAMMLESQEKLALGNSLRHALELKEIALHFQPKISLKTGRVVGTEALMRWRHGRRGNVPPSRFIPIAEDTGVIVPLGEWALRSACAHCVDMQRQLGRPLTVAVNVSPRQFNHKLWLPVVKSALADSGLNPNQLELEITESMLMQYPDDSAELLGSIRKLGVGVVVDDFGTGYSSLSYLTRFPIDKIKIDQSFVRDLTSDAKDAAVVNAIIAMARRLNIVVVAEGVETVDQQDHLVDEGCDEGQGFLYAEGLPFDELLQRFDAIESGVVLDQSRTGGVFQLAQWVRHKDGER
ncbi:MAG: EAL domain-containing protein [Nevskia sp.]|nr:EAL domain-containing protein [Nevskia sp.]